MGKGKRRQGHGFAGGLVRTAEDNLTYLTGKRKGHHAGSSGKGFRRKGNPKDRDGQTMTRCVCNRQKHFAARCPQKGSGKGSSPKGHNGVNPMGFAVFEGGEGDSNETVAQFDGLIFDDGDLPSGNNDKSAPWSTSEFTLGFVVSQEE